MNTVNDTWRHAHMFPCVRRFTLPLFGGVLTVGLMWLAPFAESKTLHMMLGRRALVHAIAISVGPVNWSRYEFSDSPPLVALAKAEDDGRATWAANQVAGLAAPK